MVQKGTKRALVLLHIAAAMGRSLAMSADEEVFQEDEGGSNDDGRRYLARRVDFARSVGGYARSRPEFAAHIAAKSPFEISERRLGGLERGENELTWREVVALVIAAETPGGTDFFLPPLTDSQREAWDRAKKRTNI